MAPVVACAFTPPRGRRICHDSARAPRSAGLPTPPHPDAAHRVPQPPPSPQRQARSHHNRADGQPAGACSAVPGADPPDTPSERAVAAVYAELTRHRASATTDDFFALGGHSLLAAARSRGWPSGSAGPDRAAAALRAPDGRGLAAATAALDPSARRPRARVERVDREQLPDGLTAAASTVVWSAWSSGLPPMA